MDLVYLTAYLTKKIKKKKMTNQSDYQNCDNSCNSGFIFGLLCGVVIGAIIAILIYKNNKTEVFEKLSQKIKDFFDNLVKSRVENTPKKNNPSRPKSPTKKFLTTTSEIIPKPEIAPVFIKPKRPAPKTFIKPKK